MQNKSVLIDFSAENVLAHITLGQGFHKKAAEPLPKDIVAEGRYVLRLTSDGKMFSDMTFSYHFDSPVDLSENSTLFFAFSPYDGEHDSQYFKNVSENMYFVEEPDPLLVSHSYITVSVCNQNRCVERTIPLTNYGFNKIYANFTGEPLLNEIDKIEFTYYIDEDVPQWQKICKLDTIFTGTIVDFTLQGGGMERLFQVKNGRISHHDGTLSYQFDPGSQLIFPDLTDAKNTVCDVFLPVKNTMLLYYSTDLPEFPLKIYYKTDLENTFSEDKAKVFVIQNATTPQMVYLNFSDEVKWQGRLTGIKLVPLCLHAASMKIQKISFEQERKIKVSAGSFINCTADAENVYFTCQTTPESNGKKLEIYEVFPHILHENLEELECVCSCVITNETMKLTTNMKKPRTTRIASQFLGVVKEPNGSYHTFDDRAMISNWRDICGKNPYDFTLPQLSADVTDPMFGARGDGFTDDTAAIQAAIDFVAKNGGGKVVVPGDNSNYGKRYIVTNLRLRSHVGLQIASGAVLWQADDISYYQEMPRFGHNVSMTGVNWPANHTTGNMPLLYAFRERNLKITGGGTIRMCDTESASEDGLFQFIGDNVCIGCADRLHVVPLAIVECNTFEVSDIHIIRSSAVFMNLHSNRRGFIGNVFMDEAKCTGADGMWPSGSDGIKFTRIVLNTNDDGLCLTATYNDPRDVLWTFTYPGTEKGTRHIELSHSVFNCHTFTASAISFCTWGTDAPNLGKMEISDIHIFDTILEGRLSIGGWTDNPYYGKTPFDASEQDDFSPVKNVCIHDCEFKSPVGISPLRITNCQNDFGYQSPSDFEYGDFQRRPAERNEGWNTGLSNWSYDTKESVEQILLYGTACAYIKPIFGKLCNLYQGLYLEKGEHTFRFSYKAAGTFTAYAKTPGGADIGKMEIQSPSGSYLKGKPWNTAQLTFYAPESALYQIGFECVYGKTIIAYVTNCKMDPK